jgi:endonuclease-3
MPDAEAREWLRTLPAVGPKTAACVLLFALGKPALPVDTHVYRVAVRLGLVSQKLTPDKAQDALESAVPPADQYLFHVLLIRHGRHMCYARNPACERCPLLDKCPAGQEFMAERAAKASTSRKPKRRSAGAAS